MPYALIMVSNINNCFFFTGENKRREAYNYVSNKQSLTTLKKVVNHFVCMRRNLIMSGRYTDTVNIPFECS